MTTDNIMQKKKGGRPSKMPCPAVLSELYVNYTAGEIAAQYGVSRDTVRGWIRRTRRAIAEGRAE